MLKRGNKYTVRVTSCPRREILTLNFVNTLPVLSTRPHGKRDGPTVRVSNCSPVMTCAIPSFSSASSSKESGCIRKGRLSSVAMWDAVRSDTSAAHSERSKDDYKRRKSPSCQELHSPTLHTQRCAHLISRNPWRREAASCPLERMRVPKARERTYPKHCRGYWVPRIGIGSAPKYGYNQVPWARNVQDAHSVSQTNQTGDR